MQARSSGWSLIRAGTARSTSEVSRPGDPTVSLATGTVLIIEDNDDIRENLGELLAGEGYTCWLASSADEALRRLEDESHAPDVILLDWRLPGLRAETFLSLLKDRATWSKARVIVQTAAMEREIPKGLPIDGLLQKPFEVPKLLALLREAVAAPGPADSDRYTS